jgi:hypothetical protein
LQHFVVVSDEPWGLPIEEKIMPQYFKEAGYYTALIGKWHLGFFKKEYTPTFRGFDYHYGYLGPYISYYDHSLIMLNKNYSRGHDMRKNLNVEHIDGKYATDVFTDEAVNLINNHNMTQPLFLLLTHLAPHTGNENKPMEAPEDVIEKFSHIEDDKRRMLAAMVHVMDEGIGKVVEALKKKNILDDTLIVVLSDNGAPTYGIHNTRGSNYPLRGQKGSVWEGGNRVAACAYSSDIKFKSELRNEFIHVTDLLPTLLSYANITNATDDSIDGVNQWNMISNNEPSARTEMLYNIEPVLGFSAIMSDGWKLVNGTENLNYSHWFGSDGSEVDENAYFESVVNSKAAKSINKVNVEDMKKMRGEATMKCDENIIINYCNPLEEPCLFDIVSDPCERNNLAQKYPAKVKFLLSRLEQYILEMVPSARQKPDPNCDPKLHDFQWTFWQDEDLIATDENKFKLIKYFLYPLCLIVIIFVIFSYIRMKTQSLYQCSKIFHS